MPHKLLVVDDEADIRKILRSALSPICEVLLASNGEEALRLLKQERPPMMLLDISMAGMSGLEVLRAARELDSGLEVLMLTGQCDVEVARRALEGGARAYITKPFDARSVRAEVLRLIELVEGAAAERAASGRPWRVREP